MISVPGAKGVMTKILKKTVEVDRNMKKELPRSVMYVASQILRDAKKMAPVRTGALRRSGRIEGPVVKSGQVRVTVAFGGKGSGVDYAPFVEFGRQSRAPMMPRPYLRPAIRKNQKALRNIGASTVSKSWR